MMAGEKGQNTMTAAENRINALFEEFVPVSGKADTVAGEIVRAVTRIAYRNWNDGDHVGVGYGKETCNPAARYLMKKAGADVAQAVSDLWGVWDDGHYNMLLERLEEAALDYIEENPELKATANSEDMYDYRDRDEDVDDEEEW